MTLDISKAPLPPSHHTFTPLIRYYVLLRLFSSTSSNDFLIDPSGSAVWTQATRSLQFSSPQHHCYCHIYIPKHLFTRDYILNQQVADEGLTPGIPGILLSPVSITAILTSGGPAERHLSVCHSRHGPHTLGAPVTWLCRLALGVG